MLAQAASKAILIVGAVRWFRWLLKAALILSFINAVFYFFEGSRSFALTLVMGTGSILKGMAIAVIWLAPS